MFPDNYTHIRRKGGGPVFNVCDGSRFRHPDDRVLQSKSDGLVCRAQHIIFGKKPGKFNELTVKDFLDQFGRDLVCSGSRRETTD